MKFGLREKRDLHEKRQKRHAARIRVLLVPVLLLLGGVGFLLWGPVLAVSDATIVGARDSQAESLRELIKSELAGGGFIPNSFVFALPKEKIRKLIQARYPEIEKVSFEWRGVHQVAVLVQERLASFLWCGEAPALEKECQYLSSGGVLIGEAPVFTGGRYIEFYGPIEAGRFADESEFISVRGLLAAVEDDKTNIKEVRVTNSRVIKMYMKEGWFLEVNIDDDPAVVKKRLLVVLGTPEIIAKRQSGTLEYINLQYGNKVFYK